MPGVCDPQKFPGRDWSAELTRERNKLKRVATMIDQLIDAAVSGTSVTTVLKQLQYNEAGHYRYEQTSSKAI